MLPRQVITRSFSEGSSWGLCALVLLVASLGCASAEKQVVSKDDALVRTVRLGREAFNEGDLDEAMKEYRRALLRAWAIDDPYESGTVAYNMAACLASRSEFTEAADWLVDARVELCRAKSSTGNAWLLSSEIAMAQDELEEARLCIDRAARVCPPCEIDDGCCLCGPGETCSDEECELSCLEKLPCLGEQVQKEKAAEECQLGYEARVHLAQARLAVKHLDNGGARGHLQCACELLTDVCDLSLQADWHDVAAQIDDLEANFLQAGAHRDRELKLLRCAGLYREMPNVLDATALSYHSAERQDLAIDRIIRSARIRLARNQLQTAWERVLDASELAQQGACEAVEIRLALTAKMIQEAIKAQDQTLDQPMILPVRIPKP